MMNEKKLKFYRYEITTLSPVHIGTQDFYEPSNYVIAAWSEGGASRTDICPECGEKIKDGVCGECGFMTDETASNHTTPDKNYLFTFTPADLKKALSPVEMGRFLRFSKQNNYEETVKFFVDNAAKIAARGQKKALVSGKVFEAYQKQKKDFEDYQNPKYQQLKKPKTIDISKQFCDPVSQKPVIPGSSLKGSVRTAILHYICKSKNIYMNAREGDILGYEGITEDPLKNLKISDTAPSDIETQIILAQASGSAGFKEYMEVIPAGSCFKGSICVPNNNGINDEPLNERLILKACSQFFKGSPFGNIRLEGNECIIRIGKHVGKDCVTTAKQWTNTFWLSEDETPFGWAKLKITEVE